MIREEQLVLSRRPYAADLGSMSTEELPRPVGKPFYRIVIQAVWFRRQKGTLRACAGHLWDHLDAKPTTTAEALQRMTDGRYGGNCTARWDGRNMWSLVDEESRERLKTILVPMLAGYPEVPPGYDGWWRF